MTLITAPFFKFYKTWAFGSDTKENGLLEKWKGRVEKTQKSIHEKMNICKKCIQPEQVRKKFTTAKAKKGEKGEQKTFKLKRHHPTPLTFLMVCHLKDNQLISTINIDKLIDWRIDWSLHLYSPVGGIYTPMVWK